MKRALKFIVAVQCLAFIVIGLVVAVGYLVLGVVPPLSLILACCGMTLGASVLSLLVGLVLVWWMRD